MENSEEIWMIWTEQYISSEAWLFKRPFGVLYYHFVYSETLLLVSTAFSDSTFEVISLCIKEYVNILRIHLSKLTHEILNL